jgi:hypothetical protein
LQQANDGAITYEGIPLREASERSRKISHLIGSMKTRWLTKK